MFQIRLNSLLAFLGFVSFVLICADRSFGGTILTETFDELAKKDRIRLEGKAELVQEGKGELLRLFGNFNLYDGKQKSRTGEMIEKYVEFSRIKWPDSGFGFYIYHMLNDDQIETLKRGVFRESAKPIWPEVKILRESGVPVYEPATKGR